ncbi:hypothetical protein [Bradyrhizobium sp.]|uniref:hypothetical protein n=1 Tax=Bradyrhizobium sp. TaxID=376 RepID=UPI0040382C54
MDIEKDRRAELIRALSGHFLCYEEVTLRHCLLTNHRIRADIVAVPIVSQFWNYPLAFEVKEPDGKNRSAAAWLQAFTQAADYVYGVIEEKRRQPRQSSGSKDSSGIRLSWLSKGWLRYGRRCVLHIWRDATWSAFPGRKC